MKKIIPAVLLVCSLASARATLFQYSVTLDGPSESPANASPGTGSGFVNYDSTAHTLQMQVTFSGLTGNVTQSHIHAPTASPFTGTSGIAIGNTSLPGFPLGATFGTYSALLDLTQSSLYNSSFLAANGGTAAGAEAAVTGYMASGRAYWNIHSTTFPGGEIRGFLVAVPEPSTLALAGLGVLGLAVRARMQKRGNNS